MILCFGTYANILKKCSLPGTTNRVIVSTLVGTIDPDNSYNDDSDNTSVSRLMTCKRDFPSVEIESSQGPIHSVGGGLTNIIALAKSISISEIENRFDSVIALLDEDKKAAVIGAMHHVIRNDDTLEGNHRSLFTRCMGDTAANTVNKHEVDIKSFLARLFLYTVLTNENTAGQDSLSEIKEKGFIERFISYPVSFVSKTESITTPSSNEMTDGINGYLQKLKDKYDSITTLLYKDTPRPFYDFYVCNNVRKEVRDLKHPNQYSYETINDATLSKLIAVSKYIILSGTGGLGKSMMMRHLMLDAINTYEDAQLIPIFIPLQDFDLSFDSITDYIYAEICNLWSELKKDDLITLLASGKALILLDGLDEIHTSKIPAFRKMLNSFVDRYHNNTFVISSRPFSGFKSFGRFTSLELQPFTKSQALALIDKLDFRSDSPKIKQRFRSLLNTELYYSHKGFSDNPLLLTIMLLTFEEYAEVPSQMHIFYQEAYQVLANKHDSTKGGYKRPLVTGWKVSDFANYFSYFCAATYSKGKTRFTYDDFDMYFRKLKEHYHITDVTTDDFIYDLCSNLCLMYEDGSKYTFTHRSFQEYFCARYFSRQKDKNLSMIIPVFDRNDQTKKTDTTLQMLFDMIPAKTEEYIILPYLQQLIEKCENENGVQTFLQTVYPEFECADGDLRGQEEIDPASNLYEFIRDHYQIICDYVDPDDYPDIDKFTQSEFVWREDINQADWKDNLPTGYEEWYGEPEVTGRIYCFDWDRIFNQPDRYKELIAVINDSNKPFVKEYNDIKRLMRELTKKAKPSGDDLFDILD